MNALKPMGLGVSLMAILMLLSGCLEQLQQRVAVQEGPTVPVPLQKQISQTDSEIEATEKLDELIMKDLTLLVNGQQDEDGWPLPPIEWVLLYEQKLCGLPKEEQQRRLDKLQATANFMNQFDTLLLASCAPDYTPSVLARSLKQTKSSRTWPATYIAYFDTLDRHLKALVRLEKLYGNLKHKMDTTIEKLTEIEVETQP